MSNDLEAIRRRHPLVHSITNLVAMNFSANVLLALGASPLMAHAMDELEEIAGKADATILNIGTPDNSQAEAMLLTGKTMNAVHKPVVLDPAGAGFTAYRTRIALRLLNDCQPTIVKGNATEIMALAGMSVHSKGMDSEVGAEEAIEAAQILAERHHTIVVVSGPTDYITDGTQVTSIGWGSPLMSRITAMGCSASAVAGAFAAVNPNPFAAAVHGMTAMGLAGQRAARTATTPGTFPTCFIDELYRL